MYQFYKIVVFVLFSIAIINIELFIKAISYNSYMSIKLSILIFLFMFWEDIMSKIVRNLNSHSSQEWDNEEDEIKLYNIPVSLIISFIFKHKWFKNKDFLSEIICDNQKYSQIGKLLEDKDILIRGKNNARILNSNIWIEEVVEILSKPTISKESDTYYSYNPAIV